MRVCYNYSYTEIILSTYGLNAYRTVDTKTAGDITLVVNSMNYVVLNLTRMGSPDTPGHEFYGLGVNVVNELLDLLSCLDYERGGDIAKTLSELYKFVIDNVCGKDTITDMTVPVKDLVFVMENLLQGFRNVQSSTSTGA